MLTKILGVVNNKQAVAVVHGASCLVRAYETILFNQVRSSGSSISLVKTETEERGGLGGGTAEPHA